MPQTITIASLRTEHKQEADAASAIFATAKEDGDRELTDEENGQFDGHVNRAKELQAEIDAAAKAEAAKAARKSQLQGLAEFQRATDLEPRITSPTPLGGGMVSNPRIIGGPDSPNFSHFGEYLFAVRDFYQSGGSNSDQRLIPMSDPQAAQANPAGQNTVIPSEGGFLVQKDQSTKIIEKAFDEGEIISLLDKLPLGDAFDGTKIPYLKEDSRAAGSRFGGVQVYWTEQGGSITATQADFGQMEWSLHKVAGIAHTTNEMLRDSVFTGAYLMRLFSRALTFAVEETVINGTGTGQPLGIRRAPCKIAVPKESGQGAATIVGDNAVQMWARLALGSRKTAVWLASQDSEPQIWKMSAYSLAVEGANTNAGNIPMVVPAGMGMNKSNYPTLFGRPIMTIEHCQTVGTEGDFILWDPSEYLMVEKEGMVAASSIHVRFVTDEQTFRVTYRVDGQPLWPNPLTPANGTTTVSPVITLAVRA